MAFFGATKRMDYATMQMLAEVRSKRGLHYDFQYGIKISKEKIFDWPEPFYTGCAIRAFFFSGENPTGKMLVRWTRDWHVTADLNSGTLRRPYATGYFYHGEDIPPIYNAVAKNTYFSMGIIMDENHFAASTFTMTNI